MLARPCTIGIFFAGLTLCALITRAQEPNNESQKPAPPAPLENSEGTVPQQQDPDASETDPSQTVPTRPLAGAQEPRPDTTNHSFLLPSFSVITQVRTNPYGNAVPNNTGVLSTTFLAGRLGLDKVNPQSELLLDYLAGGRFTNNPSDGNTAIQGLDFAGTFHSGRWTQLFGDKFSYLSLSTFGFGGIGGLSALGITVPSAGGTSPGFNPELSPDQTIVTSGPRISNAIIAQTDYALSPRSSLTFLGSYGVLKFFSSGLEDSSDIFFRGAYNYALDEKDSLAPFYQFSTYRFFQGRVNFDTHRFVLTYGRAITGRLHFRIGVGPVVEIFKSPLAGPNSLADWTLSTGLHYQHGYTGLGLYFDRGLTGGSGVLTGAETARFQGEVTRTFPRSWEGSILGGHSTNHALQQTTPNANAISPSAWFVTTRISHRFGGTGTLAFIYTMFKQTGTAEICPITVCGSSSLNHTISVAYNWALRPINIE
jgi:hypothetical protein